MRDNLDGVAVFVTVVEAGGFARAAERLALTRSAVGKTIARLETRLGARLFHRTTRSQSLTEDGQAYFERCVRALDELRTGEAMIESGRRDVAGRLRISLPVLFGRSCILPLLLELAAAHPALELDLRFSDAVVDLVADGFDLAIRNGLPGNAVDLRARKIVSQDKVLCAAPGYLAERGRPESVADLARHEAILYMRNEQIFPWSLGSGPEEAPPLRGRLRFDDQAAILEATARGMGIAWLPRWMARPLLASGALVALLDHLPSQSIDTFAVWPAAHYVPLRLRTTIDFLAAHLPARVGDE